MLYRIALIGVFLACVAAKAGDVAPTPEKAQPVKPANNQKTKTPEEKPVSKRASGPLYCKEDGACKFPFAFPQKARVVVVEIAGEVSPGMAAYVERVCAETEKGDVLLLDINTFGGRIDAAVAIRDTLLSLRDRDVVSVAYINRRAISAGALIAYSTDLIVVASGATMGAATPVSVGQDGEMKPVQEKVVSYMRSEMRSTAEARGRDGDIAEAMVDKDRVVSGLSEKGKLLTLNGRQLLDWGVASLEVSSIEKLLESVGYDGKTRNYELMRAPPSWAENVARWLSGSQVSGLLMTIGMVALMVGVYSGGSVFLLSLGGLCLAIFFFGHLITNLAGVEDILLFVLGIVLVAVEVIAPGYIVFGVVGVICIVISLALGLIDFDHMPLSVQWEVGNVSSAFALVMRSIIFTAIASYILFRFLPKTRFGRRVVLSTVLKGGALDDVAAAQQTLVGANGQAVTELRPAGKVEVADQRHDAITEIGHIDIGEPIVVVGQRGFSLIVRSARSEESVSEESKSEKPVSEEPGPS